MMKAVNLSCLGFISCCTEDFAPPDKKPFSTLRYATCTTAGTRQALPEPRNKYFNNFFALSPQSSILVQEMRQASL